MRRGLRFSAVLMVVLVALTGFKSKSRGSHGRDGGGCSSSGSHQSGSGSGSGSTGASSKEPKATVVSCAGRGNPAAKVKVRNRVGSSAEYVVHMNFEDKTGRAVTVGSAKVHVSGWETATVQVPMDEPGSAADVARCEVVSVL
ncbi:hypothetical protein [Streptomyces sp. NPDC021212]|uniref:hypothetical protein n=1 Tax=Streptomyces sp. NPDC021212 TaxID=3365118 RepID=UPI00378CCC73